MRLVSGSSAEHRTLGLSLRLPPLKLEFQQRNTYAGMEYRIRMIILMVRMMAIIYNIYIYIHMYIYVGTQIYIDAYLSTKSCSRTPCVFYDILFLYILPIAYCLLPIT